VSLISKNQHRIHREEEETELLVQKVFEKELRCGGAPADHRTGGCSGRLLPFLSGELF
jgi:hypothetical protein